MTTPVVLAPVTYQNVGIQTGFIIANAAVSSFNVYNGDLTNILLVSQSMSPQLSNSIPVQPLTNATITGKGTWYASAQSGTCASVTVSSSAQIQPSPAQVAAQIATLGLAKDATVGATNTALNTGIALPLNAAKEAGGQLATHTSLLNGSATGALISGAGRTVALETAALIATGVAGGTPGGVPLLNNHNNIITKTAQTLGAGLNVSIPAAVVQPGFVFLCSLQIPAGASNPFPTFAFQWQDQGTGQFVFLDTWYLVAGSAANFFVGRGPVLGNNLNLVITNNDAGNTLTYSVWMWQVSQFRNKSDFRFLDTAGLNGVTAFTPASSQPSAGILGARNVTLVTAGIDNVFVPPFDGEVAFGLHTASGAADCNVQIGQESSVINLISPGPFYQNNTDANGDINDVLRMPKTPVTIRLKNNNASSRQVTWVMNMLEQA